MNIFEKGLDDDVSTLIKKILTKMLKEYKVVLETNTLT